MSPRLGLRGGVSLDGRFDGRLEINSSILRSYRKETLVLGQLLVDDREPPEIVATLADMVHGDSGVCGVKGPHREDALGGLVRLQGKGLA